MTKASASNGRWLFPGLPVAVAGLVLAAFCFYQFHERLDATPSTDVGGAQAPSQNAAGREAAMGRSLSHPAPTEIASALIDMGTPDAASADAIAVAEIGTTDPLLVGPHASSVVEDSQSDAEIVDARPEPTHAVAPVPIQEAGLAALKVQLALPDVMKTAESVGKSAKLKTSSSRSAVIALPAIYPRNVVITPAMIARRSWDSAGVFVASAGLADSSPAASSIAIPGWPVVDEMPLLDPSLLIETIDAQDSLYEFLGHWRSNFNSTASDSAIFTSELLTRLIEQSSQPWQTLYEMGRLSAVLDSPSHQKLFWREAVIRADCTDAISSLRSERDVGSMEILAATFLWISHDDATAAKALRCVIKWRSPRLISSAQTTFLFADALDRVGDSAKGEAVPLLKNLVSNQSALDADDRAGAHWRIGRCLFQQRLYAESFGEISSVIVIAVRNLL